MHQPTATTESGTQYRDVPGFPGYRVGDDGSVWSNRHKHSRPWRRLKCSKNSGNYFQIRLYDGSGLRRRPPLMLVSRLILLAFVGPCPEGMEACHNDGDKSNNRPVNLRWDTRVENMADRQKHGKTVIPHLKGCENPCAKLTPQDVAEIRRLYAAGAPKSQYKMAEMFGVSQMTIQRLVTGQSYQDQKE